MLVVATWVCWISYKNRLCKTLGLLLSASLEHLVHRRNMASLSVFYRYYFGRRLSELTLNCFHFLIFMGGPLCILEGCMTFSVTIPRYYKDVNVTIIYLCMVRLKLFACRMLSFDLWSKWDKVFKNGPIKICGRQPLKNLEIFTWCILEYFVEIVLKTQGQISDFLVFGVCI